MRLHLFLLATFLLCIAGCKDDDNDSSNNTCGAHEHGRYLKFVRDADTTGGWSAREYIYNDKQLLDREVLLDYLDSTLSRCLILK